jgi:O-antigen/teichoic acid export membrane protein
MGKILSTEKEGAYRQIFKATSIFGGVQGFNIIITIIRTKLIAVLLGPAGMGIAALFNSTIGLVEALTSFGLSTSAVKNVAAAHGTGDALKLGRTVAVFRKLVWITGLLGFVIILMTSPWLSKLAFGSAKYTIEFAVVSVTLLFTQLSAGQGVILRGTRKIQYLAKSSMIGAVVGLITSVPLYYFLGEDGIVPAIIVTSVTALIINWYFSNKVEIQKVRIEAATVLLEGKDMLKMGFFISLSGLITLGFSYIVRIFISNDGGVADVGLYNAGFAIVSTYVGMVFTAMGTDYYPRLAAVANDNVKCKNEINQQAEIAILILSPILMTFFVYINWAVILLYSNKFIAVTDMIHWAALGIYFKAASWAIAFVILAKGASKVFFWNELITNVYLFAFNIIGYKLMGLTGLGISFFVSYALYFFQVYLISKYKYSFSLDKEFVKIFIIQFALALVCFIAVQYLEKNYLLIAGPILILISAVYSWKEMDKRLNLRAIIKKLLKR